MQSFERSRGKYTYYVTGYSDRALDRVAAIREVAKQTKTPKDRYTIVCGVDSERPGRMGSFVDGERAAVGSDDGGGQEGGG